MKVKSTKAWHKLPCGHAQFFDKEEDGSPGECASVHGYDRSVKMTFAGPVDEMGWIVPFGGLKVVKQFIEYYFDHVTVLPANDPRLDQIIGSNNVLTEPGGILGTVRVLPYGVSMEMSSLFIWEQVNPYIVEMTNGRCYLEKVESIEHDSNSAFIEVDEATAMRQANGAKEYLVKKPVWDWVEPQQVVKCYSA